MKIYVRRKEPGKGWRCRAVPKVGRRPVADAGAKFHVRCPDADGKFVWSQGYDSFGEAEKAAEGLQLSAKAVALGLTIDTKPIHAALPSRLHSSGLSRMPGRQRSRQRRRTSNGGIAENFYYHHL